MTLIQERRNSVKVICTFIVILAGFLLSSVHKNVAFAQPDPFAIPLEQLKKVDPENVVSFRVFEQNSQKPSALILEMNTRAGFKIYGKGLSFTYTPLDNPLPISLEFTADPVALSTLDPWYNEMRTVHVGGTRFILKSPVAILPEGNVAVKFEACSVSNCLLPTTFVLRAAKGSAGKAQKNKSGGVQDLLATGSALGSTGTSSLAADASAVASASSASGLPVSNAGVAPQVVPQMPAHVSSATSVTSLTDTVSLWVQGSLTSRSWTLFFWLFVAGLLMNLTPCVYPMIPITLNVLSSFGQNNTKHLQDMGHVNETAARHRRRKLLPLVYVAGMVLSYSGMGVVAGMTGTLFGSLLQSPAITVGLAVVMFLMGLSMLGVFNMTAVQSFATRIPIAEKYPVAGVLTMGAVSGLVSAPCTGPVLSALLLLIGQSKDPIYGFILMVFFALGFGFPYVFLGLFTQKLGRLPKAGWLLRSVKVVFGALMFALALYYVRPILGRLPVVSVVFERPTFSAVLITLLFAVVFGFVGKLKPGTPGVAKNLPSVLGEVGVVTALTFLALWLTLTVTSGFVAPVESVNSGAAADAEIQMLKTKPATLVNWEKDWRKAVQRANVERKPLLVDAWAEWCAACLKMDATVWETPEVAKVLNEHFVPVKLDFTRSTEFSEKIITRWDLSGLPAVALFPVGGNFEGAPPVLFREAIDSAKFYEAVKPFL